MKTAFGSFFQNITGIRVSDCMDIEEINSRVEEIQKTTLHIERYNSSVVPKRGSTFPYSKERDMTSIDAEIDHFLSV